MVGTVDFMGHILYGGLMLTEDKQMHSEHYEAGRARAKSLGAPLYGDRSGKEMKEYRDGFLSGVAEVRRRRNGSTVHRLG